MLSIIVKVFRSSVAFATILSVILLAASPVVPARADDISSTADLVASTILDRMNTDRIAMGLPALVESESVQMVAEDRALRMASWKLLAHVDPWGESSATLLENAGVPYGLLGENIGRTDYGVEAVAPLIEQAWMNSDPHRDNILDFRFRVVGVGVVQDGRMFYVSVIFLS
jgi:uncharacterized protein YkwD